MIRRPPRSTQSRSSAASDVYKRQPLKGREHRRGSTEVGATVVGSVLLFVGREVTEVGFHLCDISLVLRICKVRNRDRGKNADDHDDDEKLNKCKTLFVAHLQISRIAY